REFNDRAITGHDMAYIDSVLSEDFVEHNPMPGLGNDKKGALRTFESMFQITPDMKGEIIDLVIGGNRAAIRGRYSGTDSGTGPMPGVPATGKPWSVEGIDVVAVGEDGRFTEHYGIIDLAGIMTQLGLMPGAP